MTEAIVLLRIKNNMFTEGKVMDNTNNSWHVKSVHEALHFYPRVLEQPIVKLTPTQQKKQSKTTMRSFVATRKQKRG